MCDLLKTTETLLLIISNRLQFDVIAPDAIEFELHVIFGLAI